MYKLLKKIENDINKQLELYIDNFEFKINDVKIPIDSKYTEKIKEIIYILYKNVLKYKKKNMLKSNYQELIKIMTGINLE